MQGLILNLQQFNGLLIIMVIIALFVFIALHYVEAGYGKMISPKWGVAINNKLAWILMECPVFFVLLYIWSQSSRQWDTVPLIFLLLFELHYFQRS
ncbi:MAG TPA: 3-oxo-5-alpha-steroid 4-dehydrogenase, partial [Paludibacteraceae bacterium]|nr:3-oxo-5-alpha-steroid 4-dehydrogenase [Paludibacteraceae bacterium]